MKEKTISLPLSRDEIRDLLTCIRREKAFGEAAVATENLRAAFSATPPQYLEALQEKLEAAQDRILR
jgi:hypothetical protein